MIKPAIDAFNKAANGEMVIELGRLLFRGSAGRALSPLNAAGVLAGLLVMYATGVVVGG